MKAVVYKEYGDPDVLRLEDIEQPHPADDEILIKVHAAEVTKADCELRRLQFPVKWFSFPMRLFMGYNKPKRPVLGGYFAGEVVATGKEVKKHKAGDQVYGSTGVRFGAHGEYVCLPERYTIVSKPQNVSFVESAAVPLGGLNALHFMRRANIQQGESVLVNGAGGSIGTFAVQIAKIMGASSVTAVDSPIKEEMLRQIGADHFIDYTTTNFTQAGITYDVVLNMVAGIPFNDCIRILNPGGRYLLANPRISDMLNAVRVSKTTDKKAIFAFAGETEEELLTLKEMIEQDQIKPVVDKIYPLEEAAEAHRRVETEQRLGSVVLKVS